MTRTDTSQKRTDLATEVIECSCKHCTAYATKKGLDLPFRAEVNVLMLATIGATAKGRHSLVQLVVQPLFGTYPESQRRNGPWAV